MKNHQKEKVCNSEIDDLDHKNQSQVPTLLQVKMAQPAKHMTV
jgi:hypothetical protein